MSAKAQKLLGVTPESEHRRQHTTRAQPSHHTASTYSNDRPESALSDWSYRSDSTSSTSNADFATFSIVRYNPADSKLCLQYPKPPSHAWTDQRRGSGSTERSFAPPSIPTYTPPRGIKYGSYVPYGTSSVWEPPTQSRLADMSTAYPQPPTESPKKGLRKAISKLSLRSVKSRTSLAASSAPLLSPALPQLPPPLVPDSPAEEPAQVYSNFLAPTRLASDLQRLRSKTSFYSATGDTTRRNFLGHGENDDQFQDFNFDFRDKRDGPTIPAAEGEKKLGSNPRPEARPSHIGKLTSINESSSTFDHLSSKSSAKTLKAAKYRPIRPLRHQSSIQFEQTMFDFADSDSDTDSAVNEPLSPPTLQSPPRVAPLLSARQHDSLVRGDSGFVGSDDENTTQSWKVPHEPEQASLGAGLRASMRTIDDTLSDSVPSLIGSTSSRPTSWMSSRLASPTFAMPLDFHKSMVNVRESTELDQIDEDHAIKTVVRTSTPSIVQELKRCSTSNRIVACISAEEAILLARIRRHRGDDVLQLSPAAGDGVAKDDGVPQQDVVVRARPQSSYARHMTRTSNSSMPRASIISARRSIPLDFGLGLPVTVPPRNPARLGQRNSLVSPNLQMKRQRATPPGSIRRRSRVIMHSHKKSTSITSLSGDGTLDSFPAPPKSTFGGSQRSSSTMTAPATSPRTSRVPLPVGKGATNNFGKSSDVLEALQALGDRP